MRKAQAKCVFNSYLLLFDEPHVVAVPKRLHQEVENPIATDEAEHSLRHSLANFKQDLGKLGVEGALRSKIAVDSAERVSPRTLNFNVFCVHTNVRGYLSNSCSKDAVLRNDLVALHVQFEFDAELRFEGLRGTQRSGCEDNRAAVLERVLAYLIYEH